jgi:hypothetical protein
MVIRMGMAFTGLTALAASAPPSHPPVIFWTSDPVAPGETVLVTGCGLGDQPKVEIVRLPDDATTQPVAGAVNWSGAASTVVNQPADPSLKFTIPDNFRPGVFAYRISTPAGTVSGFVNRPIVHWLQGDLGPDASPGGSVRLFGRNLETYGPPHSLVLPPRLLLRGPRTVSLNLEADTWSARAALPKDLPVGDYDVSLHNGAGGDLAWSAPLKLHVAARPTWPTAIYNVADFGADGSGLRDDTAAIQAALDKAGAAGGGVVLLPRGRYQATTTLKIPRFTVLHGESEDAACLFWPDSTSPPDAMISGTNHFGVEELTIYAGNHRHILVGDTGEKPDSGYDRFWHVRIRADDFRTHLTPEEVNQRFVEAQKMNGSGDSIRIGGPGVEIGECDIYGTGRPLYLSRIRGGWVHDNQLYTGRFGWYCISGSDGLIFERNQIQGADLMSTGGGLNSLDGSKYSQNVFYSSNTVSLMNGWDRESMTSDGGGGAYDGHITACNGAHLTLAGTPKWDGDWTEAGIFVLKGRGAGQVRRVAKFNGTDVALDQPFDEPLDATSELTITPYQGHYLLVGNHFSDCGPVQFYGTGIENVVASNTGVRMQGFVASGLNYYGVQPCMRCQFLGNQLSENYYHWTSAADSLLRLSGGELGMNQGCVLRNNELRDNASIRLETVSDALVEKNSVTDSDIGILATKSSERVLITGNRFSRVTGEIVDESGEWRTLLGPFKKCIGRPEPIAVYHFDALANNRFADDSGNHLTATIHDGVSLDLQGHVGGAAKFDGTGYLQVDEPALFNAPDITVDLWVKPATLTGRRGLIAKRFEGVLCPLVIAQVGSAISFEAAASDDNWKFNFVGPSMLQIGKWTRVTVVAKQGEGVKLYLDDKLAASKPDTEVRAPNNQPLIIGRDSWGGDPPATSTPGFFVGSIDDVKIWTRALTAGEVAGNDATVPPSVY